MANGGLVHDPPAVAKYASLVQKEEAKDPVPFTPSQSYQQKADSLKEVLNTIKGQRIFEATSNADVAAAQEKYYKQTENQKNQVRVARRVMANGGLVHDPPAVAKYATLA
tara:strand:- start:81 stop:410 length:330 start_codon:yes stop_codon:yes gene_type:complete